MRKTIIFLLLALIFSVIGHKKGWAQVSKTFQESLSATNGDEKREAILQYLKSHPEAFESEELSLKIHLLEMIDCEFKFDVSTSAYQALLPKIENPFLKIIAQYYLIKNTGIKNAEEMNAWAKNLLNVMHQLLGLKDKNPYIEFVKQRYLIKLLKDLDLDESDWKEAGQEFPNYDWAHLKESFQSAVKEIEKSLSPFWLLYRKIHKLDPAILSKSMSDEDILQKLTQSREDLIQALHLIQEMKNIPLLSKFVAYEIYRGKYKDDNLGFHYLLSILEKARGFRNFIGYYKDGKPFIFSRSLRKELFLQWKLIESSIPSASSIDSSLNLQRPVWQLRTLIEQISAGVLDYEAIKNKEKEPVTSFTLPSDFKESLKTFYTACPNVSFSSLYQLDNFLEKKPLEWVSGLLDAVFSTLDPSLSRSEAFQLKVTFALPLLNDSSLSCSEKYTFLKLLRLDHLKFLGTENLSPVHAPVLAIDILDNDISKMIKDKSQHTSDTTILDFSKSLFANLKMSLSEHNRIRRVQKEDLENSLKEDKFYRVSFTTHKPMERAAFYIRKTKTQEQEEELKTSGIIQAGGYGASGVFKNVKNFLKSGQEYTLILEARLPQEGLHIRYIPFTYYDTKPPVESYIPRASPRYNLMLQDGKLIILILVGRSIGKGTSIISEQILEFLGYHRDEEESQKLKNTPIKTFYMDLLKHNLDAEFKIAHSAYGREGILDLPDIGNVSLYRKRITPSLKLKKQGITQPFESLVYVTEGSKKNGGSRDFLNSDFQEAFDARPENSEYVKFNLSCNSAEIKGQSETDLAGLKITQVLTRNQILFCSSDDVFSPSVFVDWIKDPQYAHRSVYLGLESLEQGEDFHDIKKRIDPEAKEILFPVDQDYSKHINFQNSTCGSQFCFENPQDSVDFGYEPPRSSGSSTRLENQFLLTNLKKAIKLALYYLNAIELENFSFYTPTEVETNGSNRFLGFNNGSETADLLHLRPFTFEHLEEKEASSLLKEIQRESSTVTSATSLFQVFLNDGYKNLTKEVMGAALVFYLAKEYYKKELAFIQTSHAFQEVLITALALQDTTLFLKKHHMEKAGEKIIRKLTHNTIHNYSVIVEAAESLLALNNNDAYPLYIRLGFKKKENYLKFKEDFVKEFGTFSKVNLELFSAVLKRYGVEMNPSFHTLVQTVSLTP